MKINQKKICEMYNKEVSSNNDFTMWFDRKNGDIKFNKILQKQVDELNEMEQWTFLKFVFQMFHIISMDKLGEFNDSVEGSVS